MSDFFRKYLLPGLVVRRDRRRGAAIRVYAAAAVGLIDLIANGYGLLTYAFIVLLIVPVLTVGVLRIRRLQPGAT